MLPTELRHWREMAKSLNAGRLWVKQEFRDFTASLSQDTIERLGRFYDNAVADGDVQRLNAWLETAGPPTPAASDERLVHNLLIVFQYLGMSGYKPFESYAFRPMVPPRLDWSKLPEEMSFLAGPAEKYQDVVFDEQQEDFVANATSDQRKEFEELDRLCNQVGTKQIVQWQVSMGVREHREAALVANLGELISGVRQPEVTH
jgi:hypothetical protein